MRVSQWWTGLGAVTSIALGACTVEQSSQDEARATRASLDGVAADDNLVATAGVPITLDVLANDGDSLAIVGFIQPVHGTVAFAGGVATYTANPDYDGADIFRYTVRTADGVTASAVVNITVIKPLARCTAAITGPLDAVWDDNLHLSVNALCDDGAAEVQWRRRINNTWEIVQPWGPERTLDYHAVEVHPQIFVAEVRTAGFLGLQGRSNEFKVEIADNPLLCTAVIVTEPFNGTALEVGVPTTLRAAAECPEGAAPEYQFWIKPLAEQHDWTVITDFSTIDNRTWTPTDPGEWQIKAVTRAITSHASYQAHSSAVNVTITGGGGGGSLR